MPVVDMTGTAIADDWIYPAPADTIPAPGVIVPLETLAAASDVGGYIGIAIPPNADLTPLLPLLDRVALIAIEFPKFRDGRGFTIAHALRKKHGFTGELRAVGHIIPDQFPMLRGCGFTTILTPPEHPPEQWLAIVAERIKPHPPQLLNRLVSRTR